MTGSGEAALAEGSAQPLAERYDTALLDLDGVVYVGPHAVAGVPETLTELRGRGMRTAFVTNNASRTPEAVAAHLTELGIAAAAEDVVTSAQAAATLLHDRLDPGAPVLVVGGDGLRAALTERGLRPVTSADDAVAVVQGYAADVDWRALAEAAYAVHRGAWWVAANLDATIPTPRGVAPGNGALVDAVATATRSRPAVSAGKPELALHRESMRRTGARDPLVVGDRLDTDIEGANRAGVAGLLVLTGVATSADVVLAPREQRPTYLAADLRAGLLELHPPVVRDDDGWRCGTTWVGRSAEMQVPDGASPVDVVRAACVAAWSGEADPHAVAAALAAVPGVRASNGA